MSFATDKTIDVQRAAHDFQALEGISRILNLGLPNYVSGGSDFLRDEKEEQQKVKEALVRAKLISAR